MDLLVERLGHSARLRPHSVLGMVWLQSHFEPSAARQKPLGCRSDTAVRPTPEAIASRSPPVP